MRGEWAVGQWIVGVTSFKKIWSKHPPKGVPLKSWSDDGQTNTHTHTHIHTHTHTHTKSISTYMAAPAWVQDRLGFLAHCFDGSNLSSAAWIGASWLRSPGTELPGCGYRLPGANDGRASLSPG